jgi:nicotinamide-nucleotide amidase
MVGCLRIELITIGDELLLGFTIDTNAAYLARELARVGVEIVRRTTVGDRAPDIAAAVADALARTGAIVTTGGLGPTSDDLTKPAIAALFGRGMDFDPATYARIEQRWRDRGLPGVPPETNRQQAMIPQGADVLTNNHGTAPGIWIEDDRGRWVAMLPGVPREMRGMVVDTLVPRLRERGPGSMVVVRSRTLRTTGIAESAVAERLGELARGVDGLPLAYLPGEDGVDLRLTARDMTPSDADRLLAGGVEQLRERVGRFAYGEDGADLAAVVLDACRARHLHLGVAESCTGGLLGARITAVPGSSDVFVGGVIAYANEIKEQLLDVVPSELQAFGAVSEPVALAMARGVRARTGADVGVAITGIAGPAGGSPDKPVGTVWLAVSGPPSATEESDSTTRRSVFGGDRDEIRRRAAQAALDMVRRRFPD